MAQCVTPPAPAVSPTVRRINNPLSNQQVTGVGAGAGLSGGYGLQDILLYNLGSKSLDI